MKKLRMFNFITLNGFYKDIANDIGWHTHGVEESDFSNEMLKQNNILLFGRVTYQMMAAFWPTDMAINSMPQVAHRMNDAEKIVFSKTLKKADWKNTTIIEEDIIEKVKRIKQTAHKDLTILGSGSIVNQFAEAGLIDTYQLLLDPIAIGKGTPLFHDIKQHLNLSLVDTRVFKSGSVLLTYESTN
jgi:dihydrofolate reductase